MAKTWGDYHREIASVSAQMVGSADYLDEHPECATDQLVAALFWEYVAQLRAVNAPGAS